MRFNHGVKLAMVAATAGLMLSACSADSDTDASASAAAPAAAEINVAGIAEDINTATGCEAFGGTWSGGKVAGEGVVASYEFGCDVDGDGVAETIHSIYDSVATADGDVANVEALVAETGIVKGEGYIVATTDTSHFATLAGTDAEVVREVTVAE